MKSVTQSLLMKVGLGVFFLCAALYSSEVHAGLVIVPTEASDTSSGFVNVTYDCPEGVNTSNGLLIVPGGTYEALGCTAVLVAGDGDDVSSIGDTGSDTLRDDTTPPVTPTAPADPQGSLVPEGRDGEYQVDGYGSCEFVQTVNNVIQFLIKMTAVLAVIVFIYAGYIMVISRGDSAMISQAKGLFANVLIGFVIMITAFLIINTILSILVSGTSGILNWQTIECQYAGKSAAAVDVSVSLETYDGIVIDVMTSTEGVYPDPIIKLGSGSTYVGGDCSPANLRRLGMTATQANTFSCIARPESGCNLNAQNGWTSARGVFQMTRGWNDTCHNLNIPECTAAARAAGYKVSGNLNCSSAFSGGSSPSNPSRPTPGKEDLFKACNAAASNMACNTKAALCLYNDGGKYNHWLGNKGQNHHGAQRACVRKFDPSKYNY